ncbi:MAG TPA: amidohydrolase family protein [Woeseiaceae bacterium]|nr:amidohydrolase family protein [Woeseiaceae bacterium]
MRRFHPFPTTLLLAAVFAAGCEPAETEPKADRTADIVFRNGRIYTVDINRSWADAVAIDDGRIIYVGPDAGTDKLVGPSTQVVDLEGRMMLPGFQDVHIHPIMGGIEAQACNLNGSTTLDEYLAAIDACAENNPDQAWITGGGWSMAVFGPGANASAALIDKVVPDRPVFLSSADGHSAWVNSKALEIAGITAETPDPPDGVIDRGPNGEPLGSLQEGAMYLVSRHAPAIDLEARTDGLKYAINMLNDYGITSIQDASVEEEDLKAYRALDDRGELSLRVVASLWWERDQGLEQIENFKRLREQYTGGRLRATTVKIMQDGVMENFTAAMLEPYVGQGDNKGIPMVEPEMLKKAVTALDAADFQVHFHAIGDAAIRQALDAIEAAQVANGNLDHRHHISHLELIDPADIPRFAELHVVANFQPLWAYADSYITDLTIPFIGPERARWLYPIKSVHDAGGMIAFGSDWSVSSANPLEEMETAVTRMGALGETSEPFLPQERIGLPLALAAFTINAAYVNSQEDDTGSIEVGKYADLIVLDRNLFEIDPTDISETSVLMTMIEGEVVHGDLATL